MSSRPPYSPSSSTRARIHKEAERWTLVLVRDLRFAPEKVWDAITDPAQLREWAPFDADRNLSSVGPVTLSTAKAPTPMVSETSVKRAERPRLLEFSWGEQDLRWELEPQGSGTRLTLWHNIDRRYISMGAAGWHVCFDVLEKLLEGAPMGRLVGPDALQSEGWQQLNAEYARQFAAE